MELFSLRPLLILLVLARIASGQTQTITVLEKQGLTTTITGPQTTHTPTTTSTRSTSNIKTMQSPSAQAVPAPSASHYAGENGAAGAAGPSSNAFNLSSGGFIAIIIVVIVVVIFAVVSTVLFILAKRCQWKIREAMKRASKRLAGRREQKPRNDGERRSGPPNGARKKSPGTTVARPPGQKRTAAVEVKDLEKGSIALPSSEEKQDDWRQRLRGNHWN